MSTDFYLPQAPQSAISQPKFIQTKDSSWQEPRFRTVQISHASTIQEFSSWCTSGWKRCFDLFCVIPALLLLSPILGILAIAVRLTSYGPVIFRQQRAGQHRVPFTIYKFRTMVHRAEDQGPEHTATDDPRITTLGKFLRRFKLDELPQLYNVLRGDMSLVGPRPKLPHHDSASMLCRPGVTGAATLAFRREQCILSEVPATQLEQFYQEYVIPRKNLLDAEYMQRASVLSDIRMILATLLQMGESLTHKDLYAPSERTASHVSARSTVVYLQGD